jgi:hypothetical protein
VALADGATNELPALATLRDFVRPPNEMTAIEPEDGRRVLSPRGRSPTEVKRQVSADRACLGHRAEQLATPSHANYILCGL